MAASVLHKLIPGPARAPNHCQVSSAVSSAARQWLAAVGENLHIWQLHANLHLTVSCDFYIWQLHANLHFTVSWDLYNDSYSYMQTHIWQFRATYTYDSYMQTHILQFRATCTYDSNMRIHIWQFRATSTYDSYMQTHIWQFRATSKSDSYM